jgi:hypothetical protein
MFLKSERNEEILRKEPDFCGPFPKKMFLPSRTPPVVLAWFLLVLAGCGQKPSLQEEYQTIQESAAKLSNSTVYVLDTDSSHVDWTLRKETGEWVKGSFRPEKGSLVLEKENIIAGFLEGDGWNGSIPEPMKELDLEKEKKIVLDSVPILRTDRGRKVRVDITQTSRSVDRIDFRQTVDTTTQRPSHILQANFELADSLLPVSILVREKKAKKRIVLTGTHTLHLPDFGVFSTAKHPLIPARYNPDLSVGFRLVFKPL